MSQWRLAKLAQLTPGAISRIEAGERGVRRRTLARLADALGLDAQERRALFHAAGYVADEDIPI